MNDSTAYLVDNARDGFHIVNDGFATIAQCRTMLEDIIKIDEAKRSHEGLYGCPICGGAFSKDHKDQADCGKCKTLNWQHDTKTNEYQAQAFPEVKAQDDKKQQSISFDFLEEL